jgi:hypothetical protein
MPFAPLATVRHRVVLGQPLPFGVRDADGQLLLARGQCLHSTPQLEALMQRGALVELAELIDAPARARQAPREQLPALWNDAALKLQNTLMSGTAEGFRDALDTASAPLQALVARDPDLAIFQVLREDPGADIAYGVRRSLQAAIASLLVARRLGWEDDESTRAFKAALTMNLAMLELQGQLARQASPPTPKQREALATHPMRSLRLLELAGVADRAWLDAVLHHHECEDGSGYPSGRRDAGELASLLRRADIYTSKLSARCNREAVAADQAGRQMFMQDPGHPMTAALVKEFGLYPPGCHVRLASGAVGMVVARGAAITAPVVACLTDVRGAPLAEPVRVDTAEKAHAVQAVLGERTAPRTQGLARLLAALS